MIYKIRVVSNEVDDFRRDILIDSEATFLELKEIICSCTGYDPALLSSFFICDNNWEARQEIVSIDMNVDHDMSKDIYEMGDSHLSDFVVDDHQKMLYVFDYINERSLFLQIKDTEYGHDLLNAECVYSKGEAPVQTSDIDLVDVTDTTQSTSHEFDEEFMDNTGYNDDEIEGLDELEY